MIRSIFLSLFILTFIASNNVFAAQNIIVLGDSISAEFGLKKNQGWVSLLEKRLVDSGYQYNVINASISGETSGGGLRRINQLLSTHQPKFILIALGANDGLRGFKLSQIESNLSQMVNLSLKQQASPIIIGLRLPPNYGLTYTSQFSAIFQNVGNQHQISVIPSFLHHFETDLRYFQADRIHPNALAQPLILDNIWPTLLKLLSTDKARQ